MSQAPTAEEPSPRLAPAAEPTPADALTRDDRAAAGAAVGPVSRWAVHRRLYDWVLSFAHHKHSTGALGTLSFAESSFFPIPPDVLLMPLCLGNRSRAFWFATVCTVASVLGGLFGYLIGWGAWEAVQGPIHRFVPGFTPEKFETVAGLYARYDFWIVFIASFTPIPYKVITVAAGVAAINLPMFVFASLVGRGLRFFLVAGLMWKFGKPIVGFIDRYFNLVCVLFTVLLIGGFALLKALH